MSSNVTNFYGPVNNMQMQQGTVNSRQTQVNATESVDFDKVAEFVEKVKKYDPLLEDEYGEQATEMREKLDKIFIISSKERKSWKNKIITD